MARPCVIDGVFAVDKPRSLSSAQVVRDLQRAFNHSRLFAPAIAAGKAVRDQENAFSRKRRKDKRIQVKIGHGGTLDPLATGVLVIGVGRGTKQLSRFIECTKSYDATMLFGAATDSYDIVGRVLARASYANVSRTSFERALGAFRGQIMQKPPIYSAIRMHGKRLYEYAREGLELPAEIQARPVTVEEISIIEWLEEGSHDLQLPAEEADEAEKGIAGRLLDLKNAGGDTKAMKKPAVIEEHPGGSGVKGAGEGVIRNALPAAESKHSDTRSGETSGEGLSQNAASEGTEPPASAQNPLAVRLHMTTTSGFYVRSLCHDLGKAVGSLAMMATLSRTRQANFQLGKNVIDYGDFQKSEDVWGPKVVGALEEWGGERD